MPVIRATGRGEPLMTLRGHLADLLLKELMGERTRNAPVIFEIPIGPSEMDVIVVWEAWKALPPDDRNSVIRDAYSRYRSILDRGIHRIDPSKHPGLPLIAKIQLATGVTPEESSEFLPFKVEPNLRAEEVDFDELQTLMIEAGGVEGPQGVHLRFPGARMAAEAHAALVSRMPEANWSVAEEVGASGDAW